MSNVISFEEAKARREKDKLVTPPVVEEKVDRPRTQAIMKDGIPLEGVDSLFLREAKRFRFINITTPAAFVFMNTSILPPPFPPDPYPEAA